MATISGKAGHGEPARDPRERPDASALLPPLALAAAMLATSLPAIASSSGATSAGSMTVADSLFFWLNGPDPYVQPASGTGNYRWVISRTRAALGPSWDPWANFNGVGFSTVSGDAFGPSAVRRFAYEIKDQTRTTPLQYTYWVPSYTYYPGDNIAAWLWRESGNTWRFHWWTPQLGTYSLTASSQAGYNDMQLATLGAEANGGCTIHYSGGHDFWEWRWRHKDAGYWGFFGGVNKFSEGNQPTWGDVAGDPSNGGHMAVATKLNQYGQCY